MPCVCVCAEMDGPTFGHLNLAHKFRSIFGHPMFEPPPTLEVTVHRAALDSIASELFSHKHLQSIAFNPNFSTHRTCSDVKRTYVSQQASFHVA